MHWNPTEIIKYIFSVAKSVDAKDSTDEDEEHSDNAHYLFDHFDYISNKCEGSDSENDEDSGSDELKKIPTRRRSGRKAQWSDSLVNDMVDIIINDENYKRKLIFTNVKNQKNGAIYSKVLEEMKRRASKREESVPYTVHQLRTKFKKLVGECKKAALTIKSATGIKRFQENKGYGDWFNPLFALIKTRDACQPEQAIEPSASGVITGHIDDSTSSTSQEGDNKLFVPVKRSRKTKKNTLLEETTTLLKKAIEKDPVKDLLAFMREEAEKSRQHDLMLLQLQSSQQTLPAQTFVQPAVQNVQHQVQVPVSQHGPINIQGAYSAGMASTVPQVQSQEQFISHGLYNANRENSYRYHSL